MKEKLLKLFNDGELFDEMLRRGRNEDKFAWMRAWLDYYKEEKNKKLDVDKIMNWVMSQPMAKPVVKEK